MVLWWMCSNADSVVYRYIGQHGVICGVAQLLTEVGDFKNCADHFPLCTLLLFFALLKVDDLPVRCCLRLAEADGSIR